MGSVISAALVGITYWISMGRAFYYFSFAFRKPVVIGVVIGLIYGDVPIGLVVGATIQLMYMGGIEAGGNIPSDQGLAACIAIPVAIINHLDAGTAVAIAVPFGVLGVLLNNIRRTINSLFSTRVDALVEDEKYDLVSVFSFALPWAMNFIVYFVPVFIATLLGPSAVQAVINVIPTWIMNGLANAGNMLPALGFALTLVIMGKKQYLPFFVVGFFMFAITGFSMLTGAIFALCFALIANLFVQHEEVAQ
ncbi:phosphotransferase system PTS sorbose-specific IIC subunit [Coriobacterium glomerans PW2]|uniref:Phosphotransferase system PTS sorbose-specific IIC subunit n=1 Tax=Coriobacterium glomerans (strain ATCC 49209 / DSM 20642 / JCM 10262 / PW2) TaxID=700015 RepID=F2NAX1_CORGP|nr:PTS sugar transporter subunit IIC [Coriobacterium glomerans]AEB07649.1 phosphotransferase system PTS sorbose-specific IIC subunit [Coriobacterium glomerans PW2]